VIADAGPTGKTPRRWGVWGRAALVALLVVVADQLSKHAVHDSIVPGDEHKLLPGVQLVNTRNHGVAFGFLPDSGAGVSILIALALAGLLVGGALGNVLDRVRQGAVTDFIKLPLGWPPFNLADASIVLGIAILFVLIDRSRHSQR